jgi:hypothetical protein
MSGAYDAAVAHPVSTVTVTANSTGLKNINFVEYSVAGPAANIAITSGNNRSLLPDACRRPSLCSSPTNTAGLESKLTLTTAAQEAPRLCQSRRHQQLRNGNPVLYAPGVPQNHHHHCDGDRRSYPRRFYRNRELAQSKRNGTNPLEAQAIAQDGQQRCAKRCANPRELGLCPQGRWEVMPAEYLTGGQ